MKQATKKLIRDAVSGIVFFVAIFVPIAVPPMLFIRIFSIESTSDSKFIPMVVVSMIVCGLAVWFNPRVVRWVDRQLFVKNKQKKSKGGDDGRE